MHLLPVLRLFPDQQAAAQAAGRVASRPQVNAFERPGNGAAALGAGQLPAGTRLTILPLFDRGHDTQDFFELLTRRAGHAAQFNPSRPATSSRIMPLAARTSAGVTVSGSLSAAKPSAAFSFPPYGRDIRRPHSRDKYSRSRPVNGKKRHSSTLFFPKNEASVFPVDGGHGPLRKRPWA